MNTVDIKYQFSYAPCIRNLLFPVINIFETWPLFQGWYLPFWGLGKFGQTDNTEDLTWEVITK